ncbi:GNAT family N-acetyltransferase [Muribaculum intestinale]|uniref:GNAT family N-acetyltransferase n=1 Tax=Muribaculum intestinale TaxID=1796646 RepID=UPI0025A4F817|nr:GNAT family N-acetyltransferase [Muribaculum intestinale]
MMISEKHIETERLILRPWHEDDAPALYKYASDPDVGTSAGWPPHTSVEFSREVIRTVFSAPATFAVVLKDTGEPVGCCGLVPDEALHSEYIKHPDAEIGYWIGKPYWGQGLIPEAVKAIMSYARRVLGKKNMWIAFYEANRKSRRVAEKCGFAYHHAEQSGPDRELFYIDTDM